MHSFLLFIIILIKISLLPYAIAKSTPLAQLKKIAALNSAKLKKIETHHFDLQSVQKLTGKTKILRVYIEGDGLGYQHNVASEDPSPKNLMLIKLMFLDRYSDKLYLARPCQFIQKKQCCPDFWTTKRYGLEVFEAFNEALTQIKVQYAYEQFELIGYSGGALITLLLAGSREDIKSVRTISGNLLPALTSQVNHELLSPFDLDPLKYKKKLAWVPQWHFFGGKDPLISADLVKTYVDKLPDARHIHYQIFPKVTHNKGWNAIWLKLLKKNFLPKVILKK